MKRVTYESRLRNRRIVAKRARKKAKVNHRSGYVARVKRYILEAPKIFCAYNDKARCELLDFLAKLRNQVRAGGRTLIDFSNTTKMNAGGVILFKAEVDRLIRHFGIKSSIRCKAPKSAKVKQVLQKVGVFDALKFPSNIVPKHSDVVHWNCAHGTMADGEKYEDVLGGYDGTIAQAVHSELYKGITEAMANSVHHAYIGMRKDGLQLKEEANDWWMFSQEREGKLNVVFYDVGIGIPESLPRTRPSLWEVMQRFRFTKKDSEIIKFAAGAGKSRTEKKYRGKGLPQIVSTIHKIKGSNLIVMSNRGALVLNNGEKKSIDYKKSIYGTLIMWEVPLSPNEVK
ncbi:hypothetical protein FEF65_03965 [Mariprofundus erugo]|uniref:ATP-binding protein n=1 Tax=Mariprofundus erugo TaxID=2528639 RepID=A0A5R9GQE0_9PROT|nr:hypothetical protein [Mariprofundus erugo]TLS68160.1 hypothetical protein FEF65_03965 [Mariprofundus erugo]